eukprot:778738-Pelagomonas_calceolata.AAC.8
MDAAGPGVHSLLFSITSPIRHFYSNVFPVSILMRYEGLFKGCFLQARERLHYPCNTIPSLMIATFLLTKNRQGAFRTGSKRTELWYLQCGTEKE